MPQMDGYEVCEAIKANPETAHIPVIFVSAFDDAADIVRGLSVGGADYITKPFIPEVVRARIQNILKVGGKEARLKDMNRHLQSVVGDQAGQMQIGKRNVLRLIEEIVRRHPAYDERYMERVAYDCGVLAEAMQLSADFEWIINDDFVEMIPTAVLICNIGYIAMPTEKLVEKTFLEMDEDEEFRRHPILGEEILRSIREIDKGNEYLQMARDIVLSHHEHWDGTGYPYRKSGEEIPLVARILGQVGHYAVLTDEGVYRKRGKAYTPQEAMEEIRALRGSRFDPRIVDVMEKVYIHFV